MVHLAAVVPRGVGKVDDHNNHIVLRCGLQAHHLARLPLSRRTAVVDQTLAGAAEVRGNWDVLREGRPPISALVVGAVVVVPVVVVVVVG